MNVTISVAKKKQKKMTGYKSRQVFRMELRHDWTASLKLSVVWALEKRGISTVMILPDTIVASGNWMNPLENSAKTISPK